MQESADKKVLLKISNLKQYFPVGHGLFNKANDGISLDIYEGETLGMVGESGCGKSTFGRTVLQLYRQTDGRTMYYGASLDEMAPHYVKDTYDHLEKYINKLHQLESKRDALQKEYDEADEQKRIHLANNLSAAKKQANDAYLNIANLVGGFICVKDLKPVLPLLKERYARCSKLNSHVEKRVPVRLELEEEKYQLSKLKTMNWMLPKDLRREIGDDYYPQIRRQLATKDKMQYKEGEAEVQRFPDGKVKLTLTFPNFIMIISNVTWEQLDVVFAEYF